jgi:hypothetical protein
MGAQTDIENNMDCNTMRRTNLTVHEVALLANLFGWCKTCPWGLLA